MTKSRHLLTLLKPFNLRVIAVSNYLSKKPELAASMGISELVSVEEAFKQAYVVSNHLPSLDSNYQLFKAAHFRSMREGATFINTGRGAQVNEQVLIRVMRERRDLTALLDVTDPEPPPVDSLLFDAPNIHLSAHISGSQNNETIRMADYAIDEFKRFEEGLPLQNEVLPKAFGVMA